MKKLASIITLAAALALLLYGCAPDQTTTPAPTTPKPQQTPVQSQEDNRPYDAGAWETIVGSYVRDDSSQYTNAVLALKYLSNNCAMFEFRLMEGNEDEGSADTLVLPFVLIAQADGTGRYESPADSENPFAIDFALAKDGQAVTITHTGELSISPDGVYHFIETRLEVSEVSAITILEHLPTAATSLNHNNGAYTIQYPDELAGDWFYPVQATFDDSGAVLAKFLIAKDLSAVYRADDDIEPVLIFGTAQPMLDAEIVPLYDEDMDAEDIGEWSYEPSPLVDIALDGGIILTPGQQSALFAQLPWPLPYTLKVESQDASVLTVTSDGRITAISEGTATLVGTIHVDDASRAFTFEVTVSAQALTE